MTDKGVEHTRNLELEKSATNLPPKEEGHPRVVGRNAQQNQLAPRDFL